MAPPFKLTRVPSLRTVEAFSAHISELDLNIPCAEEPDPVLLGEPVPGIKINGKTTRVWAIPSFAEHHGSIQTLVSDKAEPPF